MKKLIITLIIATITTTTFSNPLPGPFVISEVIWEEDGWKLELVFDEMFYQFYGWLDNLDDYYVTCNGDTSAFISGISVIMDQPLVITNNELVNPIDIPIEGGYVHILEYNMNPVSMGVYYGNHIYSEISAVSIGQSIVQQKFNLNGGSSVEYWWVKESEPSPGIFPFYCFSRTTFTGKVFDGFQQPVPNATIIYTSGNTYSYSPPIPEIITDEYGEFYTNQMYSRDYLIRIIAENNTQLFETIQIEPDSVNFHEFLLDSFYVSVDENFHQEPYTNLIAGPNPFIDNLEIKVNSNNCNYNKKLRLLMYDLSGNSIRESDINSPYINNINIHWDNMSSYILNSGVYILYLISDGELIASQKVVYQK